MKSWVDRPFRESYRVHEVNTVFVPELPADTVAARLGGLRRQVLETGSAGG